MDETSFRADRSISFVFISGLVSLLGEVLVGSLVEHVSVLWIDFVEGFGPEEGEKLPSLVEGGEDGSVFVVTLLDELSFESVVELEVELVIWGQSFLTDDGLHGLSILTHGVERVHLVADGWVILSGHALTNSVLHQTGERWQDVDWWIDVSLVHLSIDVDLTLSDIACEIWDWMGDIIVWHGKNGDLSDGTILTVDSTGSLVDGGKIGVHVTWITSSTWDFFSGSGDFSQSVGIGCHIGQNGQNVHVFLVGKMLSGGKSKSWSNDTLDGWIVSVVHEKDDTVHGAVHLEISLEESSGLKVDTHCCENNSEVLLGVIQDILTLDEGSLSTDLGTDFRVGKTGGREEWNLLTTSNGDHGINGRDTSLDHLLWINSLIRINGLTL